MSMKKNKIIFLRHAETEKNPQIHSSLWKLSEAGEKQAEKKSNLPIMEEVDLIYTSREQKAIQTVKELSKKIKKEISPLPFFDEVKRGDKFLSKEEFEIEKVKQLTDLSYPAFNGESGKDALTRFKSGIKKIIKDNPGQTVLIVTHGTILNIYFAHLLKDFKKLPERWKKTDFCALGIVENEKIIQDII